MEPNLFWDPLTIFEEIHDNVEQAEKIANWFSERSAPKPPPKPESSVKKDLLPFQYEKVVDRRRLT